MTIITTIMKTKLFSIMAASAACALLLASCSEKEDPNKGGDEPGGEPPVAEDVYVSLLPVGTLETFDLAHTQNGVSGEVSFSVKARLSGESAEDVTVTLKAFPGRSRRFTWISCQRQETDMLQKFNRSDRT